MFKKPKKPIICLLLIACVGMLAVPVFAEQNFGFEYATTLTLGTRDLRAIVMQIVNILLGFLGIIAIGIILYGGYLYMTSGGTADKIEKAKKVLINGAVGLGIILSSYAIAFFIFQALTKSTTSGGETCNNNEVCDGSENCANCPSDCDVCPIPPSAGGTFAVSWVDPKDAETDVPLCRLIQVKFNNKINQDTIDNIGVWGGSFAVDATTIKTDVNLWVEIDGGLPSGNDCSENRQCASGICNATCQGNLVFGKIAIWSNSQGLIFNNANDYENNTTYKITIKSDALAANGLENNFKKRLTSGDYTWTFATGDTTDTVPPTVLKIFPADGATNVCLASAVEAVFSEPMDISSLLSANANSPMDSNSNNSIYINPNISGFNKSVAGSDTLIANPKELYTANTNYIPTLDSDVIRDSCGNYLDGDADGVAEFNVGSDDYASNPNDWEFTTGATIECVPEIISIIPSAGYYKDESAINADLLTINGNYFTAAGSLIFNNNVGISSSGTNFCIGDLDYIPNQNCLTSWSDHEIKVRVPAQGGVSNGAISGNVAVEVGVNASNVIPFTVASPHIDNVLPNEGGIDQFITISGTGFGATKGEGDHVYFRRDEDGDGKIEIDAPAELVEANYPCDGNVGWTDNQIIISIPDNVNFNDNEYWSIQIVRGQTTNKYWGNLGGFKFKNIAPGPGLCSAVNIENGSDYFNLAEGMLDDAVQFAGIRFQGTKQEVNFGNYTSFKKAKNIRNWLTYSLWPDKVDADVPNIAEGRVGVYIKIDDKNSNTLNFIIHPTDAGPKINYFEPAEGAVGEYVTIYGTGFSSWDGGMICNVQFANGNGGWVNGDFNFPEKCGSNFWNDTQIVVKVPVVDTRTGLVGYWQFNETLALENGLINDSSNQNNDGILFTGSDGDDKSTDGKIDRALNFDGKDDRVHIASADNIKYRGDDMSISLWAYANSSKGFIISKPLNENQEYNYRIEWNTDNKIKFYLNEFNFTTNNTHTQNEWHHIAVTIDGNSKLVSIYIDGRLDNSASHNINNWSSLDRRLSLCIGTLYPYGSTWDGVYGGQFSFNGKIDEVAIYNRLLSPKEVENYYNLLGGERGYIKITTRDSLSDDTSDLSPSDFTITSGPAGPSICNIEPKGGPIGTGVNLFGERFTDTDKIIFFNNKNGSNFNLTNDNNVSTVVPNKATPIADDDAVSGPIIVVDDKNGDGAYNAVGEKSNGYNFAVFDCRESANGCAAMGYSGHECCYDGSCADRCANPKEATYAWNFSTSALTTCGGYGGNQCLASASCPNSPGQCSSSPAKTGVDTGSDCGTAYCNAFFPNVCAATCAFSNNSCVSGAVTCDISKDANLIVAGLSGVARCNNVSGENFWQTDVPCQSGTYLDINGKCTLGSASVPKVCNPNCADNFNCVNLGGTGGACVQQNICPSGSTCDISTVGSDNYNACKKDLPSKCECCCRVGHSDTDCCVGLTCADADCGTDDAVYKYGYCMGCAVWDAGNFFPRLSDDKCGCQNSNRICIVDEKLVSPARDTGSCGDCANINDIDFDSDGDETFEQVEDIKHECQTHSGSCCWNSLDNSCYTCDRLEVIEESCPPSAMSSPSPQKDKTDVCLNSVVYIKFNLELDPLTLPLGINVYECTVGGKSCATTTLVNPKTEWPQLIDIGSKLVFVPENDFKPDTWYKVIINKNLKDKNGLSLDSNYEWFFKTNNQATLCAIDTINVTPKDAIITEVKGTKNYNALPVGDCTVFNPLSYSWSWLSSDQSIATISNNDTVLPIDKIDPNQTATAQDKDGPTKIIASIPVELKQGETTLFVLLESPKVIDYWPNCKEACLNASVGAKFNMAMDITTLTPNIKLYKWLCGNGEVEIGEDCDDGGVKSGDGCSANCLNEGSNGATSICGNGTIEFGEECDGNPLPPQGCDMTKCTHTGSVANLSICGDKKIGEGEDCDDENIATNDGCSAACLNEGTGELAPTPDGIALSATSFAAADNTIDINLSVGTYFEPNTHYRVFFFDRMKGNIGQKKLTDLNWDFDKNNTNDSYSWSFKTKENFCSPEIVRMAPEQKVIYNINAAQEYTSSIYGSPDNCDPKGQKLNPYLYNWSWISSNESVATVTNSNNWPGCGNEKIETGEDCDDGNNLSGDGCSNVCVNEGTNKDMGLVSYWEFNEGSDVFAHDSAGDNDGVFIGAPDWITGKFGNGLEFNRESVNVGNSPSLNQGITDLTISAWIRLGVDFDISASTNYEIFSNEDFEDYGYMLRINGSSPPVGNLDRGKIHFRTNQTGVFTSINSAVNAYPNDQAWHHIAVTKNGAIGKIYLDGAEIVSSGGLADPLNSSTNSGIGGISGQTWIGAIDDVRIYRTALTGAQIQGIMNQKNYLCGNGVVDFGEDCDGSPFPAGCNINTCLRAGSMGVCGNSIIEIGEDCDDGGVKNNDGCSSTCLNQGTQTDSYTDFYQTATAKSPGKTDIKANVNYCADAPTATCGGNLAECATGACKQTTGSGNLEVVCGFSNNDSCSRGVCVNGFCSNNPNIACSVATEAANCNLSAATNITCDFQSSNHECPTAKWGGICSTNKNECYSADDCLSSEVCQPRADCNFCKNNTGFECRGNSDCQLGVGYDSCCYSRPIIESKSPDPNFFNSKVISCDNNFCSAFGAGIAACQTYSCKDTNKDAKPDTCSAYGKCNNTNGLVGYYRFDESPAVNKTAILDSSIEGKNGSLYTNDLYNRSTSGKNAGALYFDGRDDYVKLPAGFADFTKGFTVSMWAYPLNSSWQWQRFIDFGNDVKNNIIFTRTKNQTADNLIFEVYDDEISGGQVTALNAIEFRKWQYFSATVDHLGDVKIYKNAVLIEEGRTAVPQNINRVLNYIGRSSLYIENTNQPYYKGNIDDVRIYNRALAAEEITSLFNSYCLSDNDCPTGSVCDKSCVNDSQCNNIVCGACRNAQINITFDKIMDPASFTSDGICSNNSSQSCAQDSNCPDGACLKNIRLGVKYDDAAINQKNCPGGYYAENNLVRQQQEGFIAKLLAKIKTWFNKLLGKKETMAAEYWCAIPGTITSFNKNNRTTAIFTPQGLKDNLFEDGVAYRITVKHNIKSIKGVSVGKDDTNDFQYEFTAGDTECQVETVDIYVGD